MRTQLDSGFVSIEIGGKTLGVGFNTFHAGWLSQIRGELQSGRVSSNAGTIRREGRNPERSQMERVYELATDSARFRERYGVMYKLFTDAPPGETFLKYIDVFARRVSQLAAVSRSGHVQALGVQRLTDLSPQDQSGVCDALWQDLVDLGSGFGETYTPSTIQRLPVLYMSPSEYHKTRMLVPELPDEMVQLVALRHPVRFTTGICRVRDLYTSIRAEAPSLPKAFAFEFATSAHADPLQAARDAIDYIGRVREQFPEFTHNDALALACRHPDLLDAAETALAAANRLSEAYPQITPAHARKIATRSPRALQEVVTGYVEAPNSWLRTTGTGNRPPLRHPPKRTANLNLTPRAKDTGTARSPAADVSPPSVLTTRHREVAAGERPHETGDELRSTADTHGVATHDTSSRDAQPVELHQPTGLGDMTI